MTTLLEAGLQEWADDVARRANNEFFERQLRKRFGELPGWVPQRLQEARPEQLERWSEQLLDADTLNAVFDDE